MKRVLMCGNHPSNRGGMSSVIELIKSHDWKSEGFELTFVPTYLPGSKMRTLCYYGFAYVKVFFEFLTGKPDVFYTHMSAKGSFYRTSALVKLSQLFHVKCVVHLHGSEFKEWYNSETAAKKSEIRSMICRCGAFVVLGRKWEGYIRSIAPGANIVCISNAVDIPKMIASRNKEETHFLYMGVLIPRKGVIDLLKAIKLMSEQKNLGNWVFDIAGEGPEEENLRHFAEENQIEQYVRFHGWVSGKDRDHLMKNADVLILPSYHEGLPVSILEGIRIGLPVISTTVGDVAEAVINGENGYLVEPGNIEKLAECIRDITDENTWDAFSERSRQIAEQKFNIKDFYRKLKSVWESVSSQ